MRRLLREVRDAMVNCDECSEEVQWDALTETHTKILIRVHSGTCCNHSLGSVEDKTLPNSIPSSGMRYLPRRVSWPAVTRAPEINQAALECLGKGCGSPSQTTCLQEKREGEEKPRAQLSCSRTLCTWHPSSVPVRSEPGGILRTCQ
ncbi:hypothetical protein HJG60_008755 [Phyllostomus discolor]|uniref:Uncharacterized protein n=1 Tax=Phyllostomus discolor TaxID=89673 RepID=A0A833YZ98_9CHIR|nr:hypothetical protein HJG60_008755 [Phyllostomus discolor]